MRSIEHTIEVLKNAIDDMAICSNNYDLKSISNNLKQVFTKPITGISNIDNANRCIGISIGYINMALYVKNVTNCINKANRYLESALSELIDLDNNLTKILIENLNSLEID